MSTTRSPGPTGPATDLAWAHAGLLVCGHGLGDGAGSVREHARAILGRALFARVGFACLGGPPGPTEAAQSMDVERLYVAPLLMSDGYTFRHKLKREVEALRADGKAVVLCAPVGVHPGLTDLIEERAAAACAARGWPEERTGLVLVAHGTNREPRSAGPAVRHARRLAQASRFACVRPAFLSQQPTIAETVREMHRDHVVAVGLFVESGPHGEIDPRVALREVRPDAVYAGPIGADPAVADIILQQVFAAV